MTSKGDSATPTGEALTQMCEGWVVGGPSLLRVARDHQFELHRNVHGVIKTWEIFSLIESFVVTLFIFHVTFINGCDATLGDIRTMVHQSSSPV
jgi:hypothetical protein